MTSLLTCASLHAELGPLRRDNPVRRGSLIAAALLISFALGSCPLNAAPFTQTQKLTASDAVVAGTYGFSVAIDGGMAVVGAPQDRGGNSVDGQAYVSQSNAAGVWSEVAILSGSDVAPGDIFGWSTAIADKTIVIGAWGDDDKGQNAGAAYVFEVDGLGHWNETAKLLAADGVNANNFGFSVSASGDRLLIGAPHDDFLGAHSAGAAYLFERDDVGQWNQIAKLAASDAVLDDRFGRSVSLSGDRAVIGAPFDKTPNGPPGAAYVFERNALGQWNEIAKLTSSDPAAGGQFGKSVSMDGLTAVVGAPFESNLIQGSGSAYIFENLGFGNWSPTAELLAINSPGRDVYGETVSISGDVILVGAWGDDVAASNAGAAHLYRHDSAGVWNPVSRIVAEDTSAIDNFGWAVALSGSTAIIGAPANDALGLNGAGAAYIFEVPEPGTSHCVIFSLTLPIIVRRRSLAY